MLRTLYVRDYALIEEQEVEFDSGLNIITGETGAGKSILIGALGLILGERASTEAIRTGAKKAVIEGTFDEADTPRLRALLEANEIETGSSIILRREITASQSRAFINDSPATLPVVREVASQLIDLHGQHEHQSLLRVDTHLGLIDDFGGLSGMVEAYRAAYDTVAELVTEQRSLVKRERELRQQKELYEFQIEEIDRVDPQEGEDDALDSEQRVLENAERLYEQTAALYEMLYESESAIHDQLVVVRNEMQDLARIDRTFEEQLGEVRSAQIIAQEVATFLQEYNARIEFNPERLGEIRARVTELELLKRKYGQSLEAVLEHRREIGETYTLAADFEGAIQRLGRRIAEAQARLSRAAARLSSKRHEIAERVEKGIVAELAGLGMPHAVVEVRFTRTPQKDGWVTLGEGAEAERFAATPVGIDHAEFYISANPGEAPKPLARVASGGEISRIMLAMKTILAKNDRMPILVFDEIDTGISGSVARQVGESMHRLAQYHQIIAITHLAQIAGLGDVHFKVEKEVDKAAGRTRTRLTRLDDDARADQVARLISGSDVTQAALESARELMQKES
jgi:DNA repair protein RecN (Recombination protein N)